MWQGRSSIFFLSQCTHARSVAVTNATSRLGTAITLNAPSFEALAAGAPCIGNIMPSGVSLGHMYLSVKNRDCESCERGLRNVYQNSWRGGGIPSSPLGQRSFLGKEQGFLTELQTQ